MDNCEVSGLVIREATPEDTPGLLRVHTETLLATYHVGAPERITRDAMVERLAVLGGTTEQRLVKLENLIRSRQQTILTAVLDQEIVGTARSRQTDSGYEITSMYVLPEFHRLKIGSQLMKRILQDCGDRDISLQVGKHLPAVEFYKKFGFAEVPDPVKDERGDSFGLVPLNDIIMIRPGRASIT